MTDDSVILEHHATLPILSYSTQRILKGRLQGKYQMEVKRSELCLLPNRIMIFGIPGSGKSTFALELSRLLN